MNGLFFELYCFVKLLNSQIHFIFLKVAQPKVVVHTGLVSVEINRYFEFVNALNKISKLSIVDPQVVSAEVDLLLRVFVCSENLYCVSEVFVCLFELVEFGPD